MKILYATALIFSFLFATFQKARSQQSVYINEIMASNVNTVADNTGEYSDWIELFNNTSNPVDLANYYLTDNLSNLVKFRFTSTTGEVVIPANGQIVIWASGLPARGFNHTNFSLSADGEAVALVAPDGSTIIDSFSFGKQRFDVSYGRLPDGGGAFKYFASPTPNAPNIASNSYDEILTPPTFSQNGGFFSNSFSLSITHADPNVTIVYTDDSSEPNTSNLSPTGYQYQNLYPNGGLMTNYFQSYLYTSPLTVNDASSLPNRIGQIATTHSDILDYLPLTPINKGKVIRARVEKPGALPSDIVTNSYFFAPSPQNPYNLPVVSVVVQEDKMFDYNNGIYVPGVDFDAWQNTNPSAIPDYGSPSNYKRTGESAEREGHIELIETGSVAYKQDVGVRINGGWSRGFRFKSLRIYGTDQYKTIQYPLFPTLPYNSYKTFLLRNAGNDYSGTLFRDALAQKSVSHLRLDIQDYRPSILFLNGEYWGLHNFRQRLDKHYYAQKYGVNADSLDILSPAVEEGDVLHFDALRNYMYNNDIQDGTHYEYIKTQMDVENFTDYQITEIFYDNADWGNNNVHFWRLKTPFSPTAPYGRDGRWRWSLQDLDATFTFNGWATDQLAAVSVYANQYDPGFMLGRLLENPQFRLGFINRFADLLNTTFLPSRLVALMNTMKDVIAPQIPAHIDRWKTLLSYNDWLEQFVNPTLFLENRPFHQRQHILNKFGIGGEFDLVVDISDSNHGKVQVNSIVIHPTTPGVSNLPYPWTGSYFDNIPIQLKAIPNVGYRFKHWEFENTTIADSIITVTTEITVLYKAVFEAEAQPPSPIPGAFALSTPCGYQLTQWSNTNPAGTYPDSMRFVYMNTEEPTLSATIAGFTTGAYNHTSRTRINGKGADGFSFINTSGNVNAGYPNTALGGALLALNTTGKSAVRVQWTGRTFAPNSRQYRIRLRYRVGDTQPFQDLLDDSNQPVEYVRNSTSGHSQILTTQLPSQLINQPYIQLLWQYYYTGVGTSGARDELGVDDIAVTGQADLSGTVSANLNVQEGTIISVQNIQPSAIVNYTAGKSVQLNPGFQTSSGTVFTAQIGGCN